MKTFRISMMITMVAVLSPAVQNTADAIPVQVAGRDTVGSAEYPDGGMTLVDELEWMHSGRHISCGVIDILPPPYAQYGYFGTDTAPGRIIQARFGNGYITKNSLLALSPGENFLKSAVIDPVNGYAYYGTGTSPGRIVKVAMGSEIVPPVRIGAVTLGFGEDNLTCAVIDPANGYAYFGTATSPGRIVKICLGEGSDPPSRVGALQLDAGEDVLMSAVIDAGNGQAFFGTNTMPGRVVKVDLGNGSEPPVRIGSLALNEGEDYLQCGVIDPLRGYAYFGSLTKPGRVVKIALGNGSDLPVRIGAAESAGLNEFVSAVIDPQNGYAYFGVRHPQDRVAVVSLGNGQEPPELLSNIYLYNYGSPASAIIDTQNGYAYFGTYDAPANIVSIRIGATSPQYGSRLRMDINEFYLSSAVIDPENGYAYFGASVVNPGHVIKFDLEKGSNYMHPVGEAILLEDEAGIHCGVIDPVNRYAYFGLGGGIYTDKIVKIALGNGSDPPSKVGDVVVGQAAGFLSSAVIDTVHGFAYFGSGTSPSYISQIDLGNGPDPPSCIWSYRMNDGEDDLRCAVYDQTSGYSYFGTFTQPGQVVKVFVGDGSDPIERVGSVILESGEDSLVSAVIDPDNGYAYFGTSTSPGRVVKVALGNGSDPPVRVGALNLEAGEDGLSCAVIDTEGGYAYFATWTHKGQIVKIALGNGSDPPVRVGCLTMGYNEQYLTCAVLDPENKQAYFGSNTPDGTVVRAGLSQQGFIKGTRFNMPEPGAVIDTRFYSHAAAGNLRLSIYDTSQYPRLLWQSGAIQNSASETWMTEAISNGTPSILNLDPGDYWLAWQVDTSVPVPSYGQGSSGDGFWLPGAFGEFPDTLGPCDGFGITPTDEVWSGYITYEFIPEMTPTPEPAVYDFNLWLNGTDYHAGDAFKLRTGYRAPVGEPVDLYVVLQAGGSYWFWPGWTEGVDFERVTAEDNRMRYDFILDFTWPEGDFGTAEGLIFWGAMLDPATSALLADLQSVTFGYH